MGWGSWGDLSFIQIFPLFDWIFSGKNLIQLKVNKMQDFRNFILHSCILIFDAEQVYLKHQVRIFWNKEVTANPKPQT